MTSRTLQAANRILGAVTRFQMTFERDPVNGIVGLRELALALDDLTAAYFETEEASPAGEFEPPAKGIAHPSLAQRALKAFPELGHYPHSYSGADPTEEEPALANAMDDLVDIAFELIEVFWHFEELGNEEAIWHYRFGYQHHWGTRLQRLRNYLSSRPTVVS